MLRPAIQLSDLPRQLYEWTSSPGYDVIGTFAQYFFDRPDLEIA
jgi:hypothetical protein